MPDSPPRKASGRERRPTQRLKDYDRAQGRLTTLSKSVGRQVTPPTAESLAADRAKKQAAVAAARGNASQPAPLKPLQSKTYTYKEDEEDELENDDDDEAGPGLLDYQFEDLDNETDRIEWLVQNLAELSRHNYRVDPHFQDEQSLLGELDRLRSKGSVPSGTTPTVGGVPRVQTGATNILKPRTSGHSSRVQLVRMDNQTIGLDGMRVGSQDRREFGFPSPARLSRTDNTTVGLDGNVVSPPQVLSKVQSRQADPTSAKGVRAQNATTPQVGSRPAQSTSTKRSQPDDPAPSKRRAIVPRARIDALRKENAKTNNSSTAPSTRGVPKPSTSRPQPRRSPSLDIQMEDPPSDERDPQQAAGGDNRPLTPPLDEEDGQEEMQDERGAEEQVGGASSTRSKKPTKRERTQLGTFPPEARDLVQWATEEVKASLISICPFGDVMTPDPQNWQTYVERWTLENWEKANEQFREGQAHLPLQDDYACYIRNQFASVRNTVKKAADPLVTVHFNLRRTDSDRAAVAKSLTDGGDERWLSPTKQKDNQLFRHPIIADTIELAFFKGSKSFGYKHLEYFTPLIRVPTVAFVCTIIRHSIKSSESENSDLDSSKDRDIYTLYMNMLNKIQEENPVRLLNIRAEITKRYLNAQPKATVMPVPEMDLGSDEELNMDKLEEINDMLPEGIPGIEECDEVKAALRNRKGKGPARSGPSRSGY